MIAGTLIIEDLTIHFNMIMANTADPQDSSAPATTAPAIAYTISDNTTGQQETCMVDCESFFIALGIALSMNGDIPESPAKAWEQANSVQPTDPALRFIP